MGNLVVLQYVREPRWVWREYESAIAEYSHKRLNPCSKYCCDEASDRAIHAMKMLGALLQSGDTSFGTVGHSAAFAETW
jgi:hypothetical protein